MGILTLALGCGHAPPPRVIEAPNWYLWGRQPAGARVVYPDAAWNAGLEGDVVAEICLDSAGNTNALRPVSGPGPLVSATLAALATWRFDPVVDQERAIPACFRRRFYFRKAPEAEIFFRTEGEMTITRGYEPAVAEYRPMPSIAGASGVAYVRVCPDLDGVLRDVAVLQGPGMGFDDQIGKTLLQWKWRPARLRGELIASCQIQRVVLGR